MKNISFYLLLMVSLIVSSCGNVSEEELKELTSSGVVLIRNSSFYELTLSNGYTMYFSSLDEEDGIKGFSTELDSVQPEISYGTGFFISNDGKLVTNAHVVANNIKDKDVNKSMNKILRTLKDVVEEVYNETEEKLEKANLLYDYANTSSDVSYEDFYKVRDYRDELKKNIKFYRQYYQAIDDIDVNNSELKYHSEIGIAYNDTYITNSSDFKSCVMKQVDSVHDLAIIQLKDKKTPDQKYVFEVPQEDPLENYSFSEKITKAISTDKNSKLCMLSFNLGPVLANTSEGIKLQYNTGTISQNSDNRIMYSIPTLPGSSGSPVINLQGQLVAVNYAGIGTTQNFNYGIKIKYLKKLLDN